MEEIGSTARDDSAKVGTGLKSGLVSQARRPYTGAIGTHGESEMMDWDLRVESSLWEMDFRGWDPFISSPSNKIDP